jgi:hypothetical protein
MDHRPINDAYREALGLPRADACVLVAVVVAWLYCGREPSPTETIELIRAADGSAPSQGLLARLERLGLLESDARPVSNRRPYRPTRRAVRMVLGWCGRELAA